MAINNVNASYQSISASYTSVTASVKVEVATAEVTAEITQKEDGFVKSTGEKPVTYKPDMDKIKEMKADLKGNISAFRQMVQGLFGNQGIKFNESLGLGDLLRNLKVDEATQKEAQEAISEDGYWGVEATANRMLEFAKALSGGDPSKIDLLRKAVEDGFSAAEKVWGGKLPDISYQTRERVMEGFDAWAKEAAGETGETTETAEAEADA